MCLSACAKRQQLGWAVSGYTGKAPSRTAVEASGECDSTYRRSGRADATVTPPCAVHLKGHTGQVTAQGVNAPGHCLQGFSTLNGRTFGEPRGVRTLPKISTMGSGETKAGQNFNVFKGLSVTYSNSRRRRKGRKCFCSGRGTLCQALNRPGHLPPLGRCFHGSVRVKEEDEG